MIYVYDPKTVYKLYQKIKVFKKNEDRSFIKTEAAGLFDKSSNNGKSSRLLYAILNELLRSKKHKFNV